MSRSPLADAFDHHVWATLHLIDACADLTDDQLATAVPGTYGSIIDTLRHTVGADCSYLDLLSGGRRGEIEEEALDLPALRAAMAENGPIWASLLAGEPDPAAEVARVRDDGSQSIATMGVRLAQAVHHGTDHRSQVCTALTELGIEPPEIDVWSWARDQDRLRETGPSDG